MANHKSNPVVTNWFNLLDSKLSDSRTGDGRLLKFLKRGLNAAVQGQNRQHQLPWQFLAFDVFKNGTDDYAVQFANVALRHLTRDNSIEPTVILTVSRLKPGVPQTQFTEETVYLPVTKHDLAVHYGNYLQDLVESKQAYQEMGLVTALVRVLTESQDIEQFFMLEYPQAKDARAFDVCLRTTNGSHIYLHTSMAPLVEMYEKLKTILPQPGAVAPVAPAAVVEGVEGQTVTFTPASEENPTGEAPTDAAEEQAA